MDTFTATKGNVVGPYDDSVSIDAFGPVPIYDSVIDPGGDIAGDIIDETGGHGVLERGGSTTVFDGPAGSYTTVKGIDAAGDVFGDYIVTVNYLDVNHAYVYRNGTVTTVGSPGWTSSEVDVVNSAGISAGSYSDAAGSHAYVDKNGVISSFDAPAGDFAPVVNALDSNGDAAGVFKKSDYSRLQIYLYENGKLSTVDLPDGTSGSRIYGVDSSGRVVGIYLSDIDDQYHYFIANPASPTDPGLKPIAVPAGGTLVDVLGFDPQGDVVGTYYDPAKGGDRIFRTDALGVSTPVDDPPGATSTDLSSIAPDGTLFGSYHDATGTHLFTDRAGAITTIPSLSDTRQQTLTGEDAAGDVTEDIARYDHPSSTFLFRGGTSTALGVQGRPLATSLFAIDGSGDVIGTTSDADGDHMFIDKGGTVTTQDAAPGASNTVPLLVDDTGDIIGHYTASDGAGHFFVDKDGTFTTVDVPAPAGRSTVALPEIAGANGDFAGEVQFVSASAPEAHDFAYIGGTVVIFDTPDSVGIAPGFVGMDPQGDIGIVASGPSNGQVVSSLRMADGSYRTVVVPGSVAQSTVLTSIDRTGDLIGTYKAPSTQGGAPATLGFIRLAASGAYVTVGLPSGASGFSLHTADAEGDAFGDTVNPDGTDGIFEQKAGAAQGTVISLGSGTGRENLLGVDAAGDIAANAYSTQAGQDGPTQAYLVIGGKVTQVEGSSSATSTTIKSIDAAGDIIGTYTDGTGQHDFASFADSAPRISNTHTSSTSAEAPVPPFTAVTVQDLRDGGTDALTITLTGGGGTLADGAGYTGPSTLKQTGPGTYTLAGAATDITAELDALSFTPTAPAPGTPNPTTFTLTDASSVGGSATETVTDAATVVTDTAAGTPTPTPTPVPTPTLTPTPTPTPTPTATPAPTPTPGPNPAPSDTIEVDQSITYDGEGSFTITGTASSAAGVGRVEFTAQIDGRSDRPVDLGTATVDADGRFSFTDVVGPRLQGFITATETDGAGIQTRAAFHPALQAGTSPHADRYIVTPASATYTGSTYYKKDGSDRVTVTASDQTLVSNFFDTFQNGGQPNSDFVFDPGFGKDVVSLFRVDGTDHDTLSFKGSDFGTDPAGQLAGVLNHSRDTAEGLLITDPTASSPGSGGHDKVLLKGITKNQLSANTADITFHA